MHPRTVSSIVAVELIRYLNYFPHMRLLGVVDDIHNGLVLGYGDVKLGLLAVILGDVVQFGCV